MKKRTKDWSKTQVYQRVLPQLLALAKASGCPRGWAQEAARKWAQAVAEVKKERGGTFKIPGRKCE